MPNLLVIIPTYNERENIADIVRAVFSQKYPFQLLIIDDNSPDGTARLVKDMQAKEFPGRLHLMERPGKMGLGTAYIAGFKWALANGYDYIFEMDADFSHNPADLNRLYEACAEGAGLAVGSRYTRGGKVENWPRGRVMMSYYASIYVRMVLWMPVKDTTAGFVCYKREVLETLNLDEIKFRGYAFQIEMKYLTWRYGFKITEIPITFTDRTRGTSKMNKSIFKEAFLGVLKMRFSCLPKKAKG